MRIKLKIHGVIDIMANHSASLLILTDEEENRQLSIVVDEHMRNQIAIRRGKYHGDLEHRTSAIKAFQNCLPETLSAAITYLTNVEFCVIIVSIYDGQYCAILEDQRTGTAFPIRVSDGVLLAYADPHVPLYIEKSLWDMQSTKYMGENAKGVSLPLNTLSVPMLKKVMQQCIDEEKYEAAQQIKNELDKRKAIKG
ncbi:MAG: bifunctional nuclease family protein [Prevotella sp.]|nr:bifunctional nuclease family protein [Prevotella sp.]